MTPKWIHAVAAALLVSAAAPLPAFADAQGDQIRAACAVDYKRFCFGTMPGGGRIVACLGQHMAELAPLCAKIVGVGQACAEDTKKYCANVSPREGGLKRCLEQQAAKLSPRCASTLAAAR